MYQISFNYKILKIKIEGRFVRSQETIMSLY